MSTCRELIGKTIERIEFAHGGGAVRFFVIGTQEPFVYYAEGDCCSETWIQHIEGVTVLLGGTVIVTSDIDMPDLGDQPGHDVMAYYGVQIRTEKGTAVIDYRNDSNGYYGGELSFARYYSGVFGQNEPSDTWEPVTGDF